ncbi:MAG: SDR family oxidoreductase [Proteobacteria bacterium]|nr:SDR family oxidoreductase [Pseudomonadota bacterium]
MQRALIIGCGDIGRRVASRLASRYKLYALTRDPRQFSVPRVIPIKGDLDHRISLKGAVKGMDVIFHFAPPPSSGNLDTRTRHLVSALLQNPILPHRIIYISTSGVYGNRQGAWLAETTPVDPQTPRAKRRVDAERVLRQLCTYGVKINVLRTPGIYADNRLPLKRVREGIPVLQPEEDSISNHIHAEDLARIICAASRLGRTGRIYHATDGHPLLMGSYIEAVADVFGLARPPRISRKQAQVLLSDEILSFLGESRSLSNHRLDELRVRLDYPSVEFFLECLGSRL